MCVLSESVREWCNASEKKAYRTYIQIDGQKRVAESLERSDKCTLSRDF